MPVDPYDRPTAPIAAIADRPKHGRRSGSSIESQWLRVAVPAGVTVLVLCAAAFALSGPGGSPTGDRADRAAATTTTTSERVTTSVPLVSAPPAGDASSAMASTTTTAGDDPTSESTTTVPTDTGPLALCSEGQRTTIERGNHPWDWYVERFDRDGDGIFCN